MCDKYVGTFLMLLGLAGSVIAQEAKPEVLHVNWEMGKAPGAEWKTSGEVMESQNGARTLLGRITDEAATTLSMENLPEHKVLTLEVELFLVGSWDGSNSTWGPDKMNISLDDSIVLLDTTFSNCLSNNWTGSQHYPEDQTGAGNYNCFTGISHIGELGYRQVWARYEPIQNVPIDSTYRLKFSVPHTADAFTLSFQSEANEQDGDPDDQENQWYGIGNVTVSTFNEEAIDETEWAELRTKLFNSFIPISNHAFWEMMRYPSHFRADFEELRMSSPERKWWFPRAERLLGLKPAAPVGVE